MDDTQKRGQELEVGGRVSDAKFERQQEKELPALAVTEEQNNGKTRSEDTNTIDEIPEDEKLNENDVEVQKLSDDKQVPVELNVKEAHQNGNEALVNVPAEPDRNTAAATAIAEGDSGHIVVAENKDASPYSHPANRHEPVTPNSLVKCSNAKVEDDSKETSKSWLSKIEEDDESGTPEDQAAFMKELESFSKERAMEFKPPRFYGQPLNCLKLWRAVIKLGGYDRVTGSKLWRQVGESFHPPKTCTTVSWTFRIFYEKALLEYERYKTQSDELQLPVAALPEPSSVENEANGYQAPGSGRARRDAAARAMQGWHVQRLFGHGEVGEPIIKDKNLNNMPKREKSLKSIGSVKHKRTPEVEHSVKAARTETAKQLVTTVVDIGPPADWVKINVRETKDCFEVYALVPGLLREEVRVQSDPAGRLVITGQPEQPDNPWGITAFKKVVSLPARIDPLQTSAVVSLHGRLFVRVPFEQCSM
ncbi:AT-rich interactive domain-containing protein 5 [Sarracenia purpurea var. burkii]